MNNSYKYDVFLSHSSADKPAVVQIGCRLQGANLHPFLDIWYLQRGKPFQPELRKALDESRSCAVFLGPSGDGPWQSEEFQYAHDLAVRTRDEYRVIPVLLPGCDPARMDGFLALRTWIDFRNGLDDQAALDQLIATIKGEAPALGQVLPELPDAPRPYRGIERFKDSQAEFFFGRDSEIDRLTTRLQQERMLAVLGASGSGKSSLVLSGLHTERAKKNLPDIRCWQRTVFTPANNPLLQLAASLVAHLPIENRPDLIKAFQSEFSSSPDGLITALATLFPQQDHPFLLIVDQFEELFTQRPITKEELPAWRAQTTQFAVNLRSAVEKGPAWLRVIVTIRADFLDQFISDEFPVLNQLLETRQFWVTPMTVDDLREAVVRPARKRGAYFEKGLVERILREMQGEITALSLLEEALDNLWDLRRGYWLTNEAYDSIGGVVGALNSKAERTFSALSVSRKVLAQRLFVKLVQLGEGSRDTRRRITREEAQSVGDDQNDFDEVLARFSAVRLITLSSTLEYQSTAAAANTVEVTHEALIDHWSTLKRWLNDGRQDIQFDRLLTEGARRWDEEQKKKNGKPGGLLWRSPQLDLAQNYVGRQRGALSLLQTEFFQASSRAEFFRKFWTRVAWVGAPLIFFLAFSAYLISIARPDFWEPVPQPDTTEAVDDEFLPVHEIAINRHDPTLILYVARNAKWMLRPFSFVPNKSMPEFIPAVETMLKSDIVISPAAQISFEITRANKVVGTGNLMVTAVTDQEGKLRFFRTFDYRGKTTEKDGRKDVRLFVPPTLLPEDENVFDLGDYAEALAAQDLAQEDDAIVGHITDYVTKRKTDVEFDLGDGFDWGASRKQIWGAEIKIFANRDPDKVRVGNAVLAERNHDRELWTEIERSNDWQIYHQPTKSKLPGGLSADPARIWKALANHGDVASLKKALNTLEWTSENGREYLDATLISTESAQGTSELISLDWFETPQGTGPLTPVGGDWVMRIGGSSEWKVVTFPFERIRGVWSLGKDGRSALVLAGKGFFRTRDGGLSWEDSNYGETSLSGGSKVKPIIIADESSTFAFIDRGTTQDDGDNPLFRLRHRNLLQRWSAGFVELFR